MSKPGINYYDIRKQCLGPLCYDFSDADKFLNSAAVKKALGVDQEQQWQECNMLVNAQFYGAGRGCSLWQQDSCIVMLWQCGGASWPACASTCLCVAPSSRSCDRCL